MTFDSNQTATAHLQDKMIMFWGSERHRYIAMLADSKLTPYASKRVAEILKPLGQSTLVEIATWADDIKGGNINDPETLAFLKDYPVSVNKTWHFVNLPLFVTGYDRTKYGPFTNDTDVVQMIGKSVQVLQGNSKMMSDVNALRWVTHLIGDLHQPLHVSCTYLDLTQDPPAMLGDPELIVKKGLTANTDQGGNLLVLPTGDSLHGYWDSKIPSLAPGDEVWDQMPEDSPVGPPDRWAEKWAYDSVLASRRAYQPLKMEGKSGSKYKVSWQSKDAYDKECGPLVTQQLALGGQRLALMINALFKD